MTALQNKGEALENLNLKEKEYLAHLEVTKQKEAEYLAAKEDWNLAMQSGDQYAIEYANSRMLMTQEAYEKESEVLGKKKTAWEEAALNHSTYSNTIVNYEEAQTAALQGNYQEAMDILARKGDTFGNYSKRVDSETAKVLDALYLEAVEAGKTADLTKKNFEDGVEGYTKEMVTEAENNYKKAMDEFSNAYADAEAVGEDMTKGLTEGAEKKRPSLIEKAKSLISGFLSAARKEADSHSPSRKTMELGEDMGEGAEIGIEKKTKDVKKAGARQAGAVLDAYSEQEVKAQKALRNVAE